MVKGNETVIERLNHALSLELASVNQYWLHYRLLEDWGYRRIAAKERAESIEEMHHADRLIDRIIFLEGHPNLQRIAPLRVGETLREVLEGDLAAEREAQEYYAESYRICDELGDFVTKRLFQELLADEEGHIDYLETEIDLYDSLGAQNYGQLNASSAQEAE